MFWERIFKCTLHNALYLCSITNKTFIILLSFCSQIANLNIFYKANKIKCFFKIFDLLKKWVNLKEIFISRILMNFVQGGFAPKLNGSVAMKRITFSSMRKLSIMSLHVSRCSSGSQDNFLYPSNLTWYQVFSSTTRIL